MIWKKKVYIYHRFIKYSKHPFLPLSSWLRKLLLIMYVLYLVGREKSCTNTRHPETEWQPGSDSKLIFMFHPGQISLYDKLSGNRLSTHPQQSLVMWAAINHMTLTFMVGKDVTLLLNFSRRDI